MTGVFLLIAGVVGFGLYLVVGPLVISTYRRYRDRRTIVCPETDQIVEMELKAGRAGILAARREAKSAGQMVQPLASRKGCARNA